MPDHAPTLSHQVVLLYEFEGWEGVERYARSNGIPINVCRKMIDDHLLKLADFERGQTSGKEE